MNKIWLLALIASTAITLPANAQVGRKLPPTTTDSFVKQAQGNADLIYGDEGTLDVPPYDSFDQIHRINSGIYDTRAKGLTTGHGSYMPDAWGGDEWTGNEWSRSGSASNPTPPIYNPTASQIFGGGYNQFGSPYASIQPTMGGVNLQVGPVDVQVGGNPANPSAVIQTPRMPIPLTSGRSGNLP